MMEWIVLIIILIVLALKLLGATQGPEARSYEYNYRKLGTLFSPAERSFLGVLKQAVGENIQIFGKVRVADVIAPINGISRSDWQKSFNKISGKHFDFILCDKNDLSIICAVELNDSSHNSKKRKDRDIFLEGACESANIPLIQVKARSTYNIDELKQSLSVYIAST
jgi:hypothetical protein